MKKISGNPFLTKDNGRILIDSVPMDELTREFKTPILVFLENRIRNNIKSFTNIFSAEFKKLDCFYSFKANFLPDICKIIHSEKIGAELISLPELKLALKVGFLPNKIIIGGPYLPEDLIELSIKNRVRELIIYNLNDLKRINNIAQKFNHVQKVCIRVNSQKFDSKLGIKLNEKKMKKLEASNKRFHNIKINSILSHYSTQMNDIEQFKKNINSIIDSLNILSKSNISIKNINIGGGFPEATVMPKDQLKKIATYIKSTLDKLDVSYENVYVEPGRYFIGDSGLFIAKIVNVSENRWIFLNIGNHICPKFARCSLRFYNASQIDKPHKFKTSFAGIVPTDQDVLTKNYFFTEYLREGDFVLVTNVGAYCLTFSNRFPYSLPKILLIKDRDIKQIFDPYIDKDFSIN